MENKTRLKTELNPRFTNKPSYFCWEIWPSTACYQTREGRPWCTSIVYSLNQRLSLPRVFTLSQKEKQFFRARTGCQDSKGNKCLERHTLLQCSRKTMSFFFLGWCDWNVAVVTHSAAISIVFRDRLIGVWLASFCHVSGLSGLQKPNNMNVERQ